jgi:hypothetical protein
MSNICPCCNQTIRKPRALKAAAPVVVDTAAMSNAELFAHYKRTSPLGDVEFFIRTANGSPAVMARAESLRADIVSGAVKARGDILSRLSAIQDAWRREDYDRIVLAPQRRIVRKLAQSRARRIRIASLKTAPAVVELMTFDEAVEALADSIVVVDDDAAA